MLMLRTSVLIICSFLLGGLQSAFANPLRLSDATLDSISAGFVNITVDAVALADGKKPLAETFTSVNKTVSEPDENGYIYTVSIAEADAFARGSSVSTSVAAGFETDEEIVSLDFGHSLETNIVGHDRSGKAINKQKKTSQKKPANSQKNKNHKRNKKQQKRDKKHSNRQGSKHRHSVIEQREHAHITLVTRTRL